MKTGRFTFALRSTCVTRLFFIPWVMLSILTTLTLLTTLTTPLHGEGENAIIPGDVDQISAYTNFFYVMPSTDFFYYLNDRLLFLDKPDGRVMASGLRNKLLRILRWHGVIKKSLHRFKHDKNNTIAIDVSGADGYKEASILLNMLGLILEKTPEGQYRVNENPSAAITDYFRFAQFDPKTIEKQLNTAHYFYFKLKESEIPLPWDYEFLQGATGLKIDKDSFFEMLLKNEWFSLFMGMLYRLSDREVAYIGGLVKEPPFAAWKQIFEDKKFLAGMFILANGLRVDNENWVLPGGAEAEETWNRLTGKDGKLSPMEFLYRLATKDDGKLNYLYLFASFLPQETQKALFTGPNALEMEKLYDQVTLTENEKITTSQFPGLRDFNFYTLLYALHMNSGQFQFPQGLTTWLKLIPASVRADVGAAKDETTDRQVTEKAEMKVVSNAYAPDTGMKKAFFQRKRSGLYIKLGGGASFSTGGDFGVMIKTNKQFYAGLANPSPINGASNFQSFSGEIGVAWKKFSVGFELASLKKEFRIINPLNYQVVNEGSQTHRLNASALLLNVYFKILDSTSINVSLSGGGGIYFGRYKNLMRYWLVSEDRVMNVGRDEVSRKKSFGYHTGVVFDFFVTKSIALFVEGRYRFVKFNNMKGKGLVVQFLTSRDYYRSYEGDLNFSPGGASFPACFYIGDYNYPGPAENLRKARLNLDGFALTLGGKFYLH
jgi:hypothetical protein